MKSFTKPHDNLGGVLKVWAIPPSVVSISGNNLSFTSTVDIVEVYATSETLSANVKPKHDSSGLSFNIEITGSMPRPSVTDQANIDFLLQRRWMILIEDGNNEFIFYGVPQTERLKFDIEEYTGEQTADKSRLNFRFFGSTTKRPINVLNPF
jgi:hypothetical protein